MCTYAATPGALPLMKDYKWNNFSRIIDVGGALPSIMDVFLPLRLCEHDKIHM